MKTNSDSRPLPEGWEWTQLHQVCSVQGGYAFRSKDYQLSGIPILRISNINNGSVMFDEKTAFLEESFASEYADYLLNPGDIVVALSGATTGKYGVFNYAGKALLNQRVGRLKFPESTKVCSKYIFYYMEIIRQDILEEAYGAAQPNISTTKLSEFIVPLAPLPEQERIVAEIERQFTRLDTAVASLKRAQANLERYKASVLKAACEGRLVPQDPDDEPAKLLLQRILAERRRQWEEQEWQKLVEKAQKKVAQARRKAQGRPARLSDLEAEEWQDIPEDEYARYLPKDEKWTEKYEEPEGVETTYLPPLPDGWVWTTTDMITNHVTSGSRGWAKYYSDGGSLFIRVGNFIRQNNRLDFSDVVFVNPMESAETNRTRLELNDVLVTITADVGMVGLVDETAFQWGDAYINQHVGLVRMVNSNLAPFVSMAIASEGIQAQLREKQYGLTKSGLNLSDLRSLIVALPPSAEQQRIIEELERRLSIIAANEVAIAADLARAERVRQSILQQAFSGQLLPKENSGSQ